MMGPLACFLLMLQLQRWEVMSAFLIVLILGLISGLISVLQISQGPGSVFYFYRITNVGSGVGLFANRNHQAVLLACIIPIGFGLACLAMKENDPRKHVGITATAKWSLVLGAIFVFSLVMVTGSRAGLVLYGLAVALTYMFSISSRSSSKPGIEASRTTFANWKLTSQRGALIIISVIIVVAVLMSGRADTLRRLTDSGASGESRWTILEPLMRAITQFMPVGSGIGSFDPVFRGFEGRELLAPTYWNHAHNDWAEIAMTGGVPALLLLLAAIIWLVRYYAAILTNGLTRTTSGLYSFIGGSVLALTAISSFVDYPLRVPIMSCLFVMAVALISKASISASR
jgi:O-antigen ligase